MNYYSSSSISDDKFSKRMKWKKKKGLLRHKKQGSIKHFNKNRYLPQEEE